MPQHESRYRVQLYDVNAFGELPASALLRFMQQSASNASAAAGFDVEWYERQGALWLIRRSLFECLQPARYRDELAVRTWVSDMRRVRSQREYELWRVRDEALVARGWSDWVYVDTGSGKPVKVPEQIQRGLMPGGVLTKPRLAGRPSEPPAQAFQTRRRVEFAAIDSVVHVNNAYYAAYLEQDWWDALAANGWRLDPLVPAAKLRLRRLDIEYFEAARYGDHLTGLVWVTGVKGETITCAHTLQRDGQRLVHAHSEWQYGAEAMPTALRQAAQALALPA